MSKECEKEIEILKRKSNSPKKLEEMRKECKENAKKNAGNANHREQCEQCEK